jgi:hypothetical protein
MRTRTWLTILILAFMAFCLTLISFILPAKGAPRLASEWTVVITENGVERRISQMDPQDIAFPFVVDQTQAPGWFCVVKPEQEFEGKITRFVTCDYKGKTQAAIRTVCSTVTGRRSQEVWLGENYKVAVRLECASGATP